MTCQTCGGKLMLSFGGWTHVRKPATPHVVKAERYQAQSAREAVRVYGTEYADYLNQHALELAAKFPERADEFLTRSLGEALAGNDGE